MCFIVNTWHEFLYNLSYNWRLRTIFSYFTKTIKNQYIKKLLFYGFFLLLIILLQKLFHLFLCIILLSHRLLFLITSFASYPVIRKLSKNSFKCCFFLKTHFFLKESCVFFERLSEVIVGDGHSTAGHTEFVESLCFLYSCFFI